MKYIYNIYEIIECNCECPHSFIHSLIFIMYNSRKFSFFGWLIVRFRCTHSTVHLFTPIIVIIINRLEIIFHRHTMIRVRIRFIDAFMPIDDYYHFPVSIWVSKRYSLGSYKLTRSHCILLLMSPLLLDCGA